jgi:hypothetical protein
MGNILVLYSITDRMGNTTADVGCKIYIMGRAYGKKYLEMGDRTIF